jgi:thiol-disulfide isomerase/thioredoxin
MLFVNCSGQKTNTQASESLPVEPPAFQMVAIPNVLTTPEDRAEFLVKHYWDNLNFSDTSYIHFPEVTEQAFVDFIDILPYTTYPVATEAITAMLKKAETEEKIFLYFIDLYEKYLYEPNSPLRNDEFYIPVLEMALVSPHIKEKFRPTELLRVAQKNRLNQKATDFRYTLSDGRKNNLYALTTPYTLLFFYNPDCPNCHEVARQLEASQGVASLLKGGQLTILAVYTDDDIKAWRNYLPRMPKDWVISYDEKQAINSEELYDLKAIPTLYLLDADKKVLLKDVTFESLVDYLSKLS